MRSKLLAAVALSLISGLSGALGCGGDESSSSSTAAATSSSSGGTSGCFDYASFDGTTPVVGFAADVLPIFQQSCSLSSACHNNEAGTGGRPYMGTKNDVVPTAQQIQLIFDQNVGAMSVKEPDMAIVEPGDPERSFLMYKMDGVFDCPLLECTAKNACGTKMPQGGPTLAQEQLDTVRRWIAQGAKND
jgi:hypothetical protein